jgi:hypothetical protein
MGLRWNTERAYIPDLLLAIAAFIFGFSVTLSALALITAASNINKLRNAVGSWRIGITTLARSHRARAGAPGQFASAQKLEGKTG